MKVKQIDTVKVKKFEPIEISITIESFDELESLLARMNMACCDVEKSQGYKCKQLGSKIFNLLNTHHHLYLQNKCK